MEIEQRDRLKSIGVTAECPRSFNGCTIVRVPHSCEQKLELLYWNTKMAPTLDFMNVVLPYFGLYEMYESVDESYIENQVIPAMQRGCVGGMCPHVSISSLCENAKQGNVQFLALDCQSASGRIEMYYDESSFLKGRNRNNRASELAGCDVAGDAFLIRISAGITANLSTDQCGTANIKSNIKSA